MASQIASFAQFFYYSILLSFVSLVFFFFLPFRGTLPSSLKESSLVENRCHFWFVNCRSKPSKGTNTPVLSTVSCELCVCLHVCGYMSLYYLPVSVFLVRSFPVDGVR